MPRIVIALFSFLLLVPQGLRATAQLTQAFMSKQVPDMNSCSAPPATAFSTTDHAAYLVFSVSGVNVGDVIEADYYASGKLYGGLPWDPETQAGNYCYALELDIAGTTVTTLPGTWTVYIFDNSTQLGSVTFTITASGSTGGPTVVASSDPGSVTTNPFYYNNLASLTGNSMLSNFDARDIFGGTFTGAAGENGHAIFADTVPSTGYYSLQFQTKSPVQLTGYTLYLADDGTANPASRSATHFTFLAGTSPSALSVISQTNLATRGSSYYNMLGIAGTAGMSPIKVTDTFAAASSYQYFEIRFTPNSGTYPGVRVMELVATGTGGTGSASSAYYRFENGTAGATATGSGSIVDSAGNQNGTPSGAVTYSSDVPLSTVGGVANTRSLNLASNGSVQFPGAFPLNNLTNATLEFYIKPTGTGLMYFLWTRTDSTDANRFNMGVVNGNSVGLDYREPNGTQHVLTPPSYIAIASSGWTHVAVVKSGNTWTSYANGVQQGPAVTDANPNLPTNTGWTLNGSNLNQQFAGLLDELRISNTALTPSQFLPPVSGATGCTYSLSPGTTSVGAGAGSGSFSVTAGSGCAWTATSSAPSWLTTSSSGTGNGTVNYSVAANTSTSSRNGTITVGGQTFTVTQAGTGAAAGYWQYIKTDFGIQPYTGGAYPDTHSGAEGNFSVTITEQVYAGYPIPTLGATFTWSRPPTTLIPGTVLSWPVSAKLTANANNGPPYLGFSFNANSYPYLPVSNLATVSPWATYYLIELNIDWTSPVGTVVTYDNALLKSPTTIPPGTTTWMDANGQMTILTHIRGSSDYYWSYVYQWVPGDTGATCAYSLATSSASVGAAQSTGSVAVTAGSGCTWTATSNAPTWLTITGGASSTGNGTVTYSVAANTGAARSGSFTIAGQTYTVNQAAPGTTPGCNYLVSPPSQSVAAAPAISGGNITGQFTVTTNTNCAWTAVSNNSWITILAGATGSGNGVVSFKVDPNTLTTSRQGTMTIAGNTVTVTQAAGVACTYSITPTSNNMQALGGSSSITVGVTAGSNCSWTASVSSSAASWLHLGSPTSGTASGSVAYTADANTSTVSRTGTIAIATATFTLTQAGGSSATAPNINQGGIVNAVSNRGGGGIAQGSMFTIYGSNLGPTVGWTAYQFPLPDHLDPGNVTVSVTQGSTTLKAYLLFVRADQINAIMPSSVRLGDAQVTVTYNGIIGASATVTIVKVAFGMNSVNYGTGPGIIQNYNTATDHPFNAPSAPAKPRQVEIIVGTGLGAITTPDNVSPPAGAPTTPVQVVVGGIPADVAYSGRAPGNAGQDQINFTVPANAPLGCHVPVQVSAGGIWSNAVSMAISTDGKHCQDSFSPFGNVSSTGGNAGTIALIRLKFNGQSTKTGGPINAAFDLGIGAFVKNSPGGDNAYSPLTNLPPPGACSSTTNTKADQGTLTSNIFGIDPTIASTLDAGAQLTVTGGAGGASGTMTQSLGTANPYAGLLGGILNISSSMTMPPPFLDGGPFTVSGPGGKDVGPFTTNIALTPAIAWTNPPSTINRASPLTLTWTGGDSTEVVVIGGSSTDQTSKAYGGFTCVAPAGAHSFTVPVNTLADLIPVGVATSSTGAFGMLLLMPLEPGSMQFTPLPKGLDVGVVFDTTATMQQVLVQ